ncbi:hypothetical protein EAE89_22900 [Photorhabdus heterorhabditis]|nr:hypothetical protein [Photorhabdus heterorhabditis]
MKKIHIINILLAITFCILYLLAHITLGYCLKIAAYILAILPTFLLLNEIIMEISKILILFLSIVTLIYAPMGLMHGSQGLYSTNSAYRELARNKSTSGVI